MTAIDPATCWAPVPVRWRYVQPGDVTIGTAGLVFVTGAGVEGSRLRIDATSGAFDGTWYSDPDELVNVLVPIPERDAARLTVEQLGAVVVGRRMGGAA